MVVLEPGGADRVYHGSVELILIIGVSSIDSLLQSTEYHCGLVKCFYNHYQAFVSLILILHINENELDASGTNDDNLTILYRHEFLIIKHEHNAITVGIKHSNIHIFITATTNNLETQVCFISVNSDTDIEQIHAELDETEQELIELIESPENKS